MVKPHIAHVADPIPGKLDKIMTDCAERAIYLVSISFDLSLIKHAWCIAVGFKFHYLITDSNNTIYSFRQSIFFIDFVLGNPLTTCRYLGHGDKSCHKLLLSCFFVFIGWIHLHTTYFLADFR